MNENDETEYDDDYSKEQHLDLKALEGWTYCEECGDRIPWTAGATFTGTDKRKLDLAILRFWSQCQLRYFRGKKVRTTEPRHLPAQVDVFAVATALSKGKA